MQFALTLLVVYVVNILRPRIKKVLVGDTSFYLKLFCSIDYKCTLIGQMSIKLYHLFKIAYDSLLKQSFANMTLEKTKVKIRSEAIS